MRSQGVIIAAAAACVLIIVALLPKLKSTNGLDSSNSKARQLANNESATADNSTILGEQYLQGDYAKRLLRIAWRDLYDASRALRELFATDPERAMEILRKTCLEMAETNPAHALDFAANFMDNKGVPNLEREIMHRWVEEGTKEAYDHFVSRSDSVNEHHVSMMASLLQNERLEHLDDWMTQMGEVLEPGKVPDGQGKFMFGVFTQKLVTHANTESIDTVADMILKYGSVPQAAAHLTTLAPRLVEMDPEKGLDWLATVDHGIDRDLREDIVDNVIYSLGERDSKSAAKLLSSEGFIDKYYRPREPNETPEQATKNKEEFYDQMLVSYLESTLGASPGDAHFNAQNFHSEKLRAEFAARAENFILSELEEVLNQEKAGQ